MASVFPTLMGLAPGARLLVAGGTGRVGSGVTLAALKQGVRVTVATRSEERYEALKKSIPEKFHLGLSVAVGDLNTEEGAKRIFDEATHQSGGVQHVVASIYANKGCDKMCSLVAQPLKELQAITSREVTAHFLLMQAFLPYLDTQMGSTYTVVTGTPAAASTSHTPHVPANPLHSLATGAVHGLADGARAEFREARVAVNEVHLKCLVQKHTDDDLVTAGPQRLGQDLVGQAIAAVVSSGVRNRVVISCRDTARKWAGSKHVYVTKSSTRIYPENNPGRDLSA